MSKQLNALILILLFSLSSIAQGPAPNVAAGPNKEKAQPVAETKTPSRTPELTATDVETFLDGIMPLQLERDDIAGATVAVVKDGKLLFAKGYGYSDYEKKKPVSAEETLFRPGSVSKLFTWTAVMQLFEQGKLDLDRDVNEYLDFKIPDAFGKPITLKNVMTHTPGFEEQIKDLFKIGSEPPNLGTYLKTHIPARIYPPGTVPAYSNYATALAGYIVERVSGQPFNQYIDQNIFKPLGMTHSTFVQPLPQALSPLMSNGYRQATDGPKPFEVVSPAPAGSLSSTSTDMARFMLAHLQDGQLDGARILRPETARLMHSRLFGLDPAANAMCYGFYEESRNGKRIIGHGGDTLYFHSDLHLIPEAGIGFFVSHNSLGTGNPLPRTTIWEMFLDRYFPAAPDSTPTLGSAKEDAKAVSGAYMLSRRSDSSFLKVATLLGQFNVSPKEDGLIEVAQMTGANGKPKHWREVGPMTFVDVAGSDKLVFKPDTSGHMQLILPYPFFVGQRIGFFENGKVLMIVVVISLLIMLLTLLLWPIGWFVRKHYDHKLVLTSMQRLLRIGVRIVFALDLLFVGLLTGLVVYGLSHLQVFSDSGTVWFYLVQIIGVLGAVGTLLVIFNAIRAWRNREARIWSKLQATLFVLVCFGFLWFAFAGNLLRFSSNY